MHLQVAKVHSIIDSKNNHCIQVHPRPLHEPILSLIQRVRHSREEENHSRLEAALHGHGCSDYKQSNKSGGRT